MSRQIEFLIAKDDYTWDTELVDLPEDSNLETDEELITWFVNTYLTDSYDHVFVGIFWRHEEDEKDI